MSRVDMGYITVDKEKLQKLLYMALVCRDNLTFTSLSKFEKYKAAQYAVKAGSYPPEHEQEVTELIDELI
jgi:uncharacterized protein YwgA